MKISPTLDLAIPLTDLSSIQDPVQQEQLLHQLIFDETSLPFPLPAGPLFRCQMVRLGSGRMAIVLTAHHIICDGWSLDVLIHDLCAFYSEELSGKRVVLQDAVSFAEYSKNVNERQCSEEFEEAARYWRSKFKAGFPVPVLPADHPRKVRREFNARRLDQPINAAVIDNLRAVAAKSNCSFFVMLLGALAISLARISRQRQFVIALPTAEQPVIGQPSLAGHCVSLLPFVAELREDESVGTFLKRVQSDILEAQDHASFTMVSLMEELHPSALARGISPIGVGLTNVKKFRANELPCSGFSIDYDANPKSFESFEFYLNAVEREEDVELHCHYDIHLFDEITIQKWLANLVSILTDIAANKSQRVWDLARLDCGDGLPAPEVLYTQAKNEWPMTAKVKDESVKPRLTEQIESGTSAMDETGLLRKLIPLWNRVLSVREIGPDDDFFALGGQSIAAAQLFDLIEVELGCRVPLATLVDSSTPRKLARAISRANASDWRCLVPLVPSGNRPPLFLVHGAEGNILLYRSLAAHLGPDQPVFGLQSAGLHGRSSIDASFEHVARHYLDEIRRVQLHGPYMLGGYCLGGTIALEMANQLLEMGESVGLVALIETYNVRAMRWPLPLHQRLINRFILNPYFHLRNILTAEGLGKFAFFHQKLRVEMMRSQASAEAVWSHAQRILHPKKTHRIPRAKLADAYNKAFAEYEVKPYPGELTVFLAERRMAGFDAPMGGWEDVAEGGVRLFSLPMSPRGSLIEPYVRELASMLRFCIDAAAPSGKDGGERQSEILADICQHAEV